MKNIILLAVVALFLSGCAGTQQRRAEMAREFQATIPYCNSEKQCADRWSAAQIWVSRNCGMKIQLATDTVIETYNSGRKYNTMALAASVIKEPVGNGQYRILIKTGCANVFRCTPDAQQAALDFNRYVGSI